MLYFENRITCLNMARALDWNSEAESDPAWEWKKTFCDTVQRIISACVDNSSFLQGIFYKPDKSSRKHSQHQLLAGSKCSVNSAKDNVGLEKWMLTWWAGSARVPWWILPCFLSSSCFLSQTQVCVNSYLETIRIKMVLHREILCLLELLLVACIGAYEISIIISSGRSERMTRLNSPRRQYNRICHHKGRFSKNLLCCLHFTWHLKHANWERFFWVVLENILFTSL